jgi:RNA polymerase sigma factor (sigma-70 family)
LAAEPSIGRASLVEAPRVAPHAAATHGLYERHAAKIQSYCQHQLGSREEAEDAVQTTFMNAFRALGRGVVPEAESAWLFKIAENVCLSRRRSSWRRGKIESPSDFGVIEEIIPGPNRQRDELIGIEDALASMPEQQRRAILLREWQGLSYREVAEELEISQSAVETLIFRARRSLAQGLEQPDTVKTPKRKSFRRALHVVDFGTLVAAAKTLLAGSAAVKATAAAVAVTAAAGTVATVAPKVEPRSPHFAAAPKHVVAAPAPAAPAGLSFAPAAMHAGESAPKPAVAEPKRAMQPAAEWRALPAKPAKAAAAPVGPVAAVPVHQQPAAEAPAEAPKAEPQHEPAEQPVPAAPLAVEEESNEGKDERHTEGVVAPVAAAPEVQPVPALPTESTGGGVRGGNAKGGAVTPDVTVPEVPATVALAPAPEVNPGRGAPAPPAAAPPVSLVAAPVASSTPAPAAPAPQSKRRSR